MRRLHYYALPLLSRDAVIGWANVSVNDGNIKIDCGHVQKNRAIPPISRRLIRKSDASSCFCVVKKDAAPCLARRTGVRLQGCFH
jgi:hypothetical protein